MYKKKTLDTYDAVKEKALRLLEFRSHSERELTQKLRRAGASHENIEKTLIFCREYGFVDDTSYAKRKAADLLNLKKYGRRRIYSELKALGIDEDDITAAMDELDPDTEQKNLAALAEKRLGDDTSRKNIDKTIRFLVYRGYDIYDIKDIISGSEVFNDI